MSLDEQVFACPVCGALALGEPPHGWGEPCPSKVAVDQAYIAKLEAERLAAGRAQHGFAAMETLMREGPGRPDPADTA